MMMIRRSSMKTKHQAKNTTTNNRCLTSNSPPRYVRLTASDRWIESGGGGGRSGGTTTTTRTTSSDSSKSTRNSCGGGRGLVRKGYVPVMVGGEGVGERFLIPTQLMTHPSILALLELSAEEFGYKQDGVIQIPCEPDYFRDVIKSLPFKMKR